MTGRKKNAAPEDVSRGRLEALSDGVFPIVVTLLVLEIKVPQIAAHDSLYGLVMFLMALGFVLMRRHRHRRDELVQEHVDRSLFRKGTRDSIVWGPVAYAAGAGFAWVNEVAAFVCYAAIAVYFVFPRPGQSPR